MVFDRVITKIDDGKLGLNSGLYHGFPKLMSLIPGIQPESIFTIAGATGSGKSSFTNSMFIYNAFEDYKFRKARGEDISLDILVWSMEISAEALIAKGICRQVFKEFGKLVDTNYILSKGKNRISQEIYDLVLKTRVYFEELESVLQIFTTANPTGIHKTLKQHMLNSGKEFFKDKEITEGGQPKVVKVFDKYVPNKPNHFVIGIQDHVALQKKEGNLTSPKELIDQLMSYIIEDKIRYALIDVIVQQVNRNLEQFERLKDNAIDLQLSDLRDSSDSAHGSDYVLGITNPFMFEKHQYRSYNTERLGDRFRSLKIIKNRDGEPNVICGMAYLGEASVWRELPSGKDMKEENYLGIENIKKYG